MKKKTLLLASLFISFFLILFSVKSIFAFWPFDLFNKNSTQGTKFPELIQKIVDKFKLDTNKVQEVIDQTREEKRNQIRERQKERLREAVEKGIITESQMNAILEKQQEWQKRAEKIYEEQRKLMEEKREWFSQNGIDMEKLLPYEVGFGVGFGRGGFQRKLKGF